MINKQSDARKAIRIYRYSSTIFDLIGKPAVDWYNSHGINMPNDSTDWSHNAITITCPCNIQRYFTALKMTIFSRFLFAIFIFLLKTYIVGTR